MASQYHQDYMRYFIGDVRNYWTFLKVIPVVDIVIHAAAMKRVETCNLYQDEAYATNVKGTDNLINAIRTTRNHVEWVVGVSSDKRANPSNYYGETKAQQETNLLKANDTCGDTKFISVRYGNVMGSRGSVLPIWQGQIQRGESVTVTDPDMTRFFLSLDQAVDTIMYAISTANSGEVYIPHSLPAARIGDLADLIIRGSDAEIMVVGKGLGEKMHETLLTGDEADYTVIREGYYVVTGSIQPTPAITKEYVSRDYVLSVDELRRLLVRRGIIKGVLT
jgi:UDP-glucose 4-epimerase